MRGAEPSSKSKSLPKSNPTEGQRFLGFDVYTSKGQNVYLVVGAMAGLLVWCSTKLFYPDMRREEEVKEDLWLSLCGTFGSMITMGSMGNYLVWFAIVRTSCKHSVASESAQDNVNGIVTTPIVIDSELIRDVFKLVGSTFLVQFIFSYLTGGIGGSQAGLFYSFFYGFYRLLPRSAERWCPSKGRRLVSVARRGFIVTGAIGTGPAILMPLLLDIFGSQTLTVAYPFLVSFLEFLSVSVVFTDELVKGHTPEGLAVVGRWFVGLFEASRIGMLVVMTNYDGDFSDLVIATMWSVVLDALTRNDMISNTAWVAANLVLPRRIVQALADISADVESASNVVHPKKESNIVPHGDSEVSAAESTPAVASQESPLYIMPPLPIFKEIYLGCKEVEYFTTVVLLSMQALNWGFPQKRMGISDETGELPEVLAAGLDMLAVIFGGQVLGQLLSAGLGKIVFRWAPSLAINAPSYQPGRSIWIHFAMWQTLASLNMLGLAAMVQVTYED